MFFRLNGGLTHRLTTTLVAGVATVAINATVSTAFAADTSATASDAMDLFKLDLAQAVGTGNLPGADFFLNRQPNTVIEGPTALTNTAQLFYDNALPQAGILPGAQTLIGQAPAAFAAPSAVQGSIATGFVDQQYAQPFGVAGAPQPAAFTQTQALPTIGLQAQPQYVQQVASSQQYYGGQGPIAQQPQVQFQGWQGSQPWQQPQPAPWAAADPCPQSGMVYPAVQQAVSGAGATVYTTRDGRGLFFEVPLSVVYGDGGQAASFVAASIANILRNEQALYVQVIGHTDRKAGRSDASDLAYSQSLADWMGQLFVANGASQQFVQSVGFGHRLAAATGNDARIEVRLVPAANCLGFNQGGGSVGSGSGYVGGGAGYTIQQVQPQPQQQFSYQTVGYGPGAGFASPAGVPQVQSDILPSYGFGASQPLAQVVGVQQVGFDPYQAAQAAFSAPVPFQTGIPTSVQGGFQQIAQPAFQSTIIPGLQPGQVTPDQILGGQVLGGQVPGAIIAR